MEKSQRPVLPEDLEFPTYNLLLKQYELCHKNCEGQAQYVNTRFTAFFALNSAFTIFAGLSSTLLSVWIGWVVIIWGTLSFFGIFINRVWKKTTDVGILSIKHWPRMMWEIEERFATYSGLQNVFKILKSELERNLRLLQESGEKSPSFDENLTLTARRLTNIEEELRRRTIFAEIRAEINCLLNNVKTKEDFDKVDGVYEKLNKIKQRMDSKDDSGIFMFYKIGAVKKDELFKKSKFGKSVLLQEVVIAVPKIFQIMWGVILLIVFVGGIIGTVIWASQSIFDQALGLSINILLISLVILILCFIGNAIWVRRHRVFIELGRLFKQNEVSWVDLEKNWAKLSPSIDEIIKTNLPKT